LNICITEKAVSVELLGSKQMKRLLKSFHTKEKEFALIEVLVVVAILGVIAYSAIIFPS